MRLQYFSIIFLQTTQTHLYPPLTITLTVYYEEASKSAHNVLIAKVILKNTQIVYWLQLISIRELHRWSTCLQEPVYEDVCVDTFQKNKYRINIVLKIILKTYFCGKSFYRLQVKIVIEMQIV